MNLLSGDYTGIKSESKNEGIEYLQSKYEPMIQLHESFLDQYKLEHHDLKEKKQNIENEIRKK